MDGFSYRDYSHSDLFAVLCLSVCYFWKAVSYNALLKNIRSVVTRGNTGTSNTSTEARHIREFTTSLTPQKRCPSTEHQGRSGCRCLLGQTAPGLQASISCPLPEFHGAGMAFG